MNKRNDLTDKELYDLWVWGASYREIGKVAECSPNTVRARILKEKERQEKEKRESGGSDDTGKIMLTEDEIFVDMGGKSEPKNSDDTGKMMLTEDEIFVDIEDESKTKDSGDTGKIILTADEIFI